MSQRNTVSFNIIDSIRLRNLLMLYRTLNNLFYLFIASSII